MAVTSKKVYNVYKKISQSRAGMMTQRAGAATLGFASEKGRQGLSAANQKRIEKGITFGPVGTLKLLGKMAGKASGLMGINFSIGSLLKQSQLFTGVLGTIFQILGAMVDAFLAPLMPYFVKLIRRMVTWIPWAQEKGEQFANWIQKILDTTNGPMGFIKKFLTDGLTNTLSLIGEIIVTALQTWWSDRKGAIKKDVTDSLTPGADSNTREFLRKIPIFGNALTLMDLGKSYGQGNILDSPKIPNPYAGRGAIGDASTNPEAGQHNFRNGNSNSVEDIMSAQAAQEMQFYN
tara:strand:+ start:3522 stop:4394 length:873 start_codon:yes stop_codon:yes gene_type:complete